jgi:hypothetical protein
MSHSSWSRRGVDGRDNPRIKSGREASKADPKRAANSYRYKSFDFS